MRFLSTAKRKDTVIFLPHDAYLFLYFVSLFFLDCDLFWLLIYFIEITGSNASLRIIFFYQTLLAPVCSKSHILSSFPALFVKKKNVGTRGFHIRSLVPFFSS